MEEIRKLERRAKAIANRRRLLMLSALKRRSLLTSAQLAETAHVRVQSASQHLRILKDANIVADRKRGLHVFYVLAPKQESFVSALLRQL